jgi:hypothetical protein
MAPPRGEDKGIEYFWIMIKSQGWYVAQQFSACLACVMPWFDPSTKKEKTKKKNPLSVLGREVLTSCLPYLFL